MSNHRGSDPEGLGPLSEWCTEVVFPTVCLLVGCGLLLMLFLF